MSEDYYGEKLREFMQMAANEVLKEGYTEEALEEFLKSEGLKNVYARCIDEIAEDGIRTIAEITEEKLREQRQADEEFLIGHHRIWGKAFDASEMLYICTLESAEKYDEFVMIITRTRYHIFILH